MVNLKGFFLINNESSLLVFSKHFGSPDLDQDMVSALLSALVNFGEEVIAKRAILSLIEFQVGDSVIDLLFERGSKYLGVAILSLPESFNLRELSPLRKRLSQLIEKIEALERPDSQLVVPVDWTLNIENLTYRYFLRELGITKLYDQTNITLPNLQALFFDIVDGGMKKLQFYHTTPDFIKILPLLPTKVLSIFQTFQEQNALISIETCHKLLHFNQYGQTLDFIRLLQKKGIIRIYESSYLLL